MSILEEVQLLVFTLGVLCFGSLLLAWWEEWRRNPETVELGHGVIGGYSLIWFLVNLLGVLSPYLFPEMTIRLRLLIWGMAYFFPPMILQITYSEARRQRKLASLMWKAAIPAGTVAAVAGAVPPFLAVAGVDSRAWFGWSTWIIMLLFSATGVYSLAISLTSRRGAESPGERSARRWEFVLWGLVVFILGCSLIPGPADWRLFALIGPSLPLLFVFASTYHLERFLFFDLFVKRGAFFCVVLGLMALQFGILSNFLEDLELRGVRPWLYALSLLPLILLLPWLYRKLEGWVDRVWLGRQFPPAEAVKHFLSGIQSVSGEAELTQRAQALLGEIFQAPCQILLDGSGSGGELEISFRAGTGPGAREGTVSLCRRPNRQPYYNTDRQLLGSLTEILAKVLENVRLEERRRIQEARERELKVYASQSELKALRAQVNPHFLFNALNAIAGLIPESPERAEETVEQLAEVFRYTLRGSQQEWALLRQEFDFVRAYLDVEKARFGERLEVSYDIDPSLLELRVPTMVVQTLVENAVKHGVSRVRGTGRIRIWARVVSETAQIEVRDNGPRLTESQPATGGFGLESIRERLAGYFGSRARLELCRDAKRAETVARLEIPVPDLSPSPGMDDRKQHSAQ